MTIKNTSMPLASENKEEKKKAQQNSQRRQRSKPHFTKMIKNPKYTTEQSELYVLQNKVQKPKKQNHLQ